MVFWWSFKGVTWMFHESYMENWRVFWGSFNVVSRKFQGCFLKISRKRKHQGCFKGVSWFSRVFPKCFKKVSMVFWGSFKDVLRVFHDFQGHFMILKGVPKCFIEVSRKLLMCFKTVSCSMALIAASRAEEGLVEWLNHKNVTWMFHENY